MGAAVGTGKGPRSDINITPLVDVVLVLLIIFMVLTPLMEKELAVRVPDDTNEPTPPPDPNEQQYLFKVDATGRFLLNGAYYDDDAMIMQLRNAYKAARAKGEAVIFFDADDAAKYVRAVKGLDVIRDATLNLAGSWTIGMMTDTLEAAENGTAPAVPGAPAAPGAPAPPTPPAPPAPPK